MKSVEVNFDQNWKNRKESHYNHWTDGVPQNQIQFAFRQHWLTFQKYLSGLPVKSVLEVGCGRGTISSYFAEAGYDVTLLDISESVIGIARTIFSNNGHSAHYVVGDAFHMSFEDHRYGVCVSIGLFEHFDDVSALLREQLRVLVPGGMLLAYIVPERPDNIQRYFRWLVALLKGIAYLLGGTKKNGRAKATVYRNGLSSGAYITELAGLGVTEVEAFGMYPLPMISHSPEFPFSLLPAPFERLLVMVFSIVLGLRKLMFGNNPWICREETGQAFLVAGRKPQ